MQQRKYKYRKGSKPNLKLASRSAPIAVPVAVPKQDRPAMADKIDIVLKLKNFFKPKKAEVKRVFLFVAADEDNLAVLLDCIYTAHLVKERHGEYERVILVHQSNELFLKQTGIFDRIIALNGVETSRKVILRLKPDVLFNPDPALKQQLAALFTGVKMKIGRARHPVLSGLFNHCDADRPNDLARLEKKGINLQPELVSFSLRPDLDSSHLVLPAENFIWLSLFDQHDTKGGWQVSHAGRLARLLAGLDTRLVIPTPPGNAPHLEEEITYLEQNAPTAVVVRNCTPQDRLAGMLRAKVIVGPSGPETLLASLIRKPVITLHDMLSFHRRFESPDAHEHRLNGKPALASRAGTPLFNVIDSLQNHLKPAVDCSDECPVCMYGTCLEQISPERVFESIKEIL